MISDAKFADRKAVLDAILDMLVSKTAAIRVTYQKNKYVTGNNSALAYNNNLNASVAFSGTSQARIGIHDDCFLADSTDSGTFEVNDMAAGKAWLAIETKYVGMGGESCALNLSYANCSSAIALLSSYHWSYLNSEYHPDVLAKWKTDGCYSEISQRLGYRFSLINMTVDDSVATGGLLHLQLSINNTGFAAPINPKTFQLVLI